MSNFQTRHQVRRIRQRNYKLAERLVYLAMAIGVLPVGYVCAFFGFVAGGGIPNATDWAALGPAALVGGAACLVALVGGLGMIANGDR